jgi:hypothetical protein
MMLLAETTKSEIENVAGLAQRNRGATLEMFAAEDNEKALIILDGSPQSEHPLLVPVDLLFSGGKFGPNRGPYLFMVGIWLPAVDRAEFLDWYRNEHLPILLECPTWNGCRFVESAVSEGNQFYALHQLADRSALQSEERRRSRATPWFLRLKQHPWFDEPFARQLYVSCSRAG